MKTKIILLVLTFTLLLTCDIFSQTISITSISKTQFCVGDEFTVDYVATGTFDDDNVFVVQLSYPDGNFNNFYNIGNLQSKISGTIQCKIPKNLSIDSTYKLRIISSEPYIVGSDFNSFLKIYKLPIAKFELHPRSILTGESITFTNTSYYATNAFWEFGDSSLPQTFSGWNPPPIIYNSTGLKEVILRVTNEGGCTDTNTNFTKYGFDKINVLDCYPKIKSNAIVITSDTTLEHYYNKKRNVWLCSSGTLNLYDQENTIIYMESGSVLNLQYGDIENGDEVIYMKPGACVNVDDFLTIPVVYKDNISINYPSSEGGVGYKLKCDDLQFDYTEAPEAGKIAQHLAVDDNSSLNNLNIFPNPSNGLFNISLNSEVPSFTVTIYDVLGSEIYYENVKNIAGTWNKKIDLSRNSKGMYFIKILGLEQSIIRSLILR